MNGVTGRFPHSAAQREEREILLIFLALLAYLAYLGPLPRWARGATWARLGLSLTHTRPGSGRNAPVAHAAYALYKNDICGNDRCDPAIKARGL